MEQAEKGVEKGVEAADPDLEKAQEAEKKGVEAAIFGLGKYEEFESDYKSRRDNANPDDYRKYPFEIRFCYFQQILIVIGKKPVKIFL